MPTPLNSKLIYALIALAGIALFGWLTAIELRAEEPRRAVISMEMILSGNWLIPTLNGWPYYNKPPLFNWLMAFFMWITGSFSEAVVRLPSLVAFIGMLFVIRHAAKRYLQTWKESAVLVPLGALVTVEFLFLGTINSGEIDLFYSFLVCCQVYAIFHFSQERKWMSLFVFSYLFTAMGFLSKGMPSVAFQGLTLLPWLVFTRSVRRLFSWQHVLGVITFIVICGAVLLAYHYNGALEDLLARQVKEASQRYSGELSTGRHLLLLAGYPVKLLGWLLPWSLLLPAWFIKPIRKNLIHQPIVQFILLFICFNLPLYWISSAPKSRYIFMFIPWMVLLLMAAGQEAFNQGYLKKPTGYLKTAVAGLWLIGLLTFLSLLLFSQLHALPYFYWRIAVIVLLMTTLFLVQKKWMTNAWLRVFAFLLIARIGFNMVYLPYTDGFNPKVHYRQNVTELLQSVDNKPIMFHGRAYTFQSDIRFAGEIIIRKSHHSAPLIPYQIPYYMTKTTRQIMYFDTIPVPGQYYLSGETTLPAGQTVLDSIDDYWLKRKLYLFRQSF